MLDWMKTWAVSAAVAVVMSVVLQALLPDTSIKKYIRVVLGVVVTAVMLAPLITLFTGVDVAAEAQRALSEMRSVSEYECDAAEYKDYIYEVYMDGG